MSECFIVGGYWTRLVYPRHPTAGQNRGTVRIFVDDSDKPKFDSGGNYEEVEFG
jgi:hypothetical protein